MSCFHQLEEQQGTNILNMQEPVVQIFPCSVSLSHTEVSWIKISLNTRVYVRK